MSAPRSIHEAATEVAMSIEDFAETAAYRAGVADGSIVAWIRTGGTPEAEAAPPVASDPVDPEPAPAPAPKAKHSAK